MHDNGSEMFKALSTSPGPQAMNHAMGFQNQTTSSFAECSSYGLEPNSSQYMQANDWNSGAQGVNGFHSPSTAPYLGYANNSLSYPIHGFIADTNNTDPCQASQNSNLDFHHGLNLNGGFYDDGLEMSSIEVLAAGPVEPHANNTPFGFGWNAEQHREPLGDGGVHDNLATNANFDVLLNNAEGTENLNAWF
jgi:hypothetical protein